MTKLPLDQLRVLGRPKDVLFGSFDSLPPRFLLADNLSASLIRFMVSSCVFYVFL